MMLGQLAHMANEFAVSIEYANISPDVNRNIIPGWNHFPVLLFRFVPRRGDVVFGPVEDNQNGSPGYHCFRLRICSSQVAAQSTAFSDTRVKNQRHMRGIETRRPIGNEYTERMLSNKG